MPKVKNIPISLIENLLNSLNEEEKGLLARLLIIASYTGRTNKEKKLEEFKIANLQFWKKFLNLSQFNESSSPQEIFKFLQKVAKFLRLNPKYITKSIYLTLKPNQHFDWILDVVQVKIDENSGEIKEIVPKDENVFLNQFASLEMNKKLMNILNLTVEKLNYAISEVDIEMIREMKNKGNFPSLTNLLKTLASVIHILKMNVQSEEDLTREISREMEFILSPKIGKESEEDLKEMKKALLKKIRLSSKIYYNKRQDKPLNYYGEI